MKRLLSVFIAMVLIGATGIAQIQADTNPLMPQKRNAKSAAIMSPKSLVYAGDTLSYCGNEPYYQSVGFGSNTTTMQWGIMLPSWALSGRNYLKSVMVYMHYEGSFTLSIYTGGTDTPGTLLHSQTASFASYQLGWNEILIDTVCNIAGGNLWIVFENTGLPYPAAVCEYTGDVNSDWYRNASASGTWSHLYDGGLEESWLIKAVTSATVPTPAPMVTIYGPSSVAVGDTAAFLFSSPNTTSMSWNITADYLSTSGDTARAVWNTAGLKYVIANATNSYGSNVGLKEVEVVNCAVSTFPHTWDFEDAGGSACWKFVDMDGSSDGWYYYINSTYHYSPDSSNGFIYSRSYNGSPNNWIISPAVQLPTGQAINLSWDAGPYSDGTLYSEHYTVLVSTTGRNVNDFTALASYDILSYDWTHPSLDLSAYAGQTIYLAIQHHQCNANNLMIDNITVEVGNPVTFTCSGNGSGRISGYINGNNYNNLCGSTRIIEAGEMVSLELFPSECNLAHLYVNNTDCIANVTNGTYSFVVAGATTIEAVFDISCDTITSFPYVMGFEETYSSNCFTIIDADIDGWTWSFDTWRNSTFTHNGSVGIAASASYINEIGSLSPDNWMILPAMSLPAGSGAVLKWFVNTIEQSEYQYEHYSVYVSTTGNSISNFTTEVFSETTTYGWKERTVDLTAYAGQTVYIAFRHHSCSDMFWLLIDDISVEIGNTVSINCTGNASGLVLHANSSNYEDLCGTAELLETNSLASYYFIPADGASLAHLYVNDVDRISDVVTHASGTSIIYTYSFTVTGATALRPVFNYPSYDVTINCTGDGSGQVYNAENYSGNLCGEVDAVRQGFIASYDFIPAYGCEMTHLYVNNVDHINDAYAHTYGSYSSTVDYYSYSFNVSGATTVAPVFSRIPYTISATSNNTTMGMVTGGGTYFYDSLAVITATPMPHYQFLHWLIVEDGDTVVFDEAQANAAGISFNPLQFEVFGNLTLVAVFSPQSYTINVSPNNVLYGTALGGGTFEYLQPVTVSAAAYSGYHFTMWSNGSTYNPYTFPASEDLDLQAIFVADDDPTQYFAITVTSNDETMGTVSGGGVFAMGQSATLTATANDGYHFVQWNDGNTANPRTVVVTANAEYTAYFATNQGITYTIIAVSADNQMGTVTGGGIYSPGDEVTLTAEPNEGYRFEHWQDGNRTNPRTIIVEADATYVATFVDVNAGIGDIEAAPAVVYSYEDHIFVSGIQGRCVKVFDITGRMLTSVDRPAESIMFTIQHTGVYIVTVGNSTYRVLVR